MKTLLVSLAIASPALATTYIKQPIPTYFNNAETVALIYVTKAELVLGEYQGKKVGCGELVAADVVEAFKGNATTVQFLMSGMQLSPGTEYFVYVEKGRARDVTPITSTNSLAQSEDAIIRQACSSHENAPRASWLSTSEFVSRWSDEKKEYERWIVPAYNIEIPPEAGVTFRSVELQALKIDGQVISHGFWSVDAGVPMPHIFWMYEGAYEWESYKTYLKAVTHEPEDNKPVNQSR